MLPQDLFGIKGDGVADDSAGINAYSAAVVAAGGTQIDLEPGRTYRVGYSLLPRQNVIWDFHGSTVISGVGYPTEIGIFANPSDATKTLIGRVTADIVGPTSQLPLSSVAGLSVGSWVAIRLGNNPWDTNEARYSVVVQVTAINGNIITIDWVIPYSIPIVSAPVATADNSSVWLLNDDFPLNVTFCNGVIVGDTGLSVEGGFYFQWGVNIKFENIIGNPGGIGDMGAGLFVLGRCRHVEINNAMLGCNSNTRGQASCGRMFSLFNCIDVVAWNPVAKNIHNRVAFVEGFSENIVFEKPFIVHRNESALGVVWSPFSVVQGSSVRISNPTIITDVQMQQFRDVGGTDCSLIIDGLFTWRGPLPLGLFNRADMRGVFDFANPADGQLVKQFNYPPQQEFGSAYGGYSALVNA
jgi:hypothetical protein